MVVMRDAFFIGQSHATTCTFRIIIPLDKFNNTKTFVRGHDMDISRHAGIIKIKMLVISFKNISHTQWDVVK